MNKFKKICKLRQLTCSLGARAIELDPGSGQVVDEFTLSGAALIEASVSPLAADGFQALKV